MVVWCFFPCQLFSCPWFNPSLVYSMLKNLGGGAGNKGSGAAGAGWGDTSGELWSGGGGKGRPPPGLGGAKPGVTPTSTNGWSAPRWSQSTSTGGQPSNWNASTWLLLRNLTPQVSFTFYLSYVLKKLYESKIASIDFLLFSILKFIL